MRGKDIVVGGEYAATSGTNSFNRTLTRARRVEVLETGLHRTGWRTAQRDGVRVRFLDEGTKELYMGLFARHPQDTEQVISSRDVWMPWHEIVGRIEEAQAKRAEGEERRAASKARRDVILNGIEGVAGTVDEIRWEPGRIPEADMIELPAEVVEALLDRIDS